MWIFLAAAASACMSETGPAPVSAPETAMCPGCNIVIIVLDAARADHLPCYGYGRETAPNVCGLAEDGWLFRNAYSNAPSTKPAIASLFTSAFPRQHNSVYNEDMLGGSLTTAAELLSGSGYATYGVNDNPVLNRGFGYERGFGEWVDTNDKGAAEVNRAVFERMGRYGKPFLLYVHYMEPHAPYQPPAEFVVRLGGGGYSGNVTGSEVSSAFQEKTGYFLERPGELARLMLLYDANIAYADSGVGGLIGRMKADGTYNRTVIVVLSDHGEMFLEHGLLGHSNGLFYEVVHIPLIIWVPGAEKAVFETPAQTIDVLPTVLDIVGVAAPETMMGDSLLSLQNGVERPIYSEHLRSGYYNTQESLIFGGYQLLIDSPNGTRLLFDLKNDPEEKEEISGESPVSKDLVGRMDGILARINSSASSPRQTVKISLDAKERLKSLGYVN
jgi:arylsulfatase A-like enzyme